MSGAASRRRRAYVAATPRALKHRVSMLTPAFAIFECLMPEPRVSFRRRVVLVAGLSGSCVTQAPVTKPITECSHCREPIESVDIVVPFDDGDVIHVRCWRVGEMRLRRLKSRILIRSSQKTIDESRRPNPPTNVPASVVSKIGAGAGAA